MVLIHTPIPAAGLAKKFLHNFKGPYKVTKKLSPLVYQVRTLRPPIKEFSVSVQRMKPYVVRRIDEEDILTFIPSLMPLTSQDEAPKDSTNLQDEQLRTSEPADELNVPRKEVTPTEMTQTPQEEEDSNQAIEAPQEDSEEDKNDTETPPLIKRYPIRVGRRPPSKLGP